MTEPKLPVEPTSTSQDVLVSHEYIDYVSALREAAEKALALAAERDVEIARLNAEVSAGKILRDGIRKQQEAANARAEAAQLKESVRERRESNIAALEMADKCVSANARAEAAQANDRRYRWLRDQHWTMETLIVTAPKENMIGFDCPSLERLDAAIDAMVKS